MNRNHKPPIRLVVLLSGGGRTLLNLTESITENKLPAVIVGVLSSHADAFGVERAQKLDLPCCVIDHQNYKGDSAKYSRAISEAVDGYQPDLVVLAGFIRKWEFPKHYAQRVMNIHPALLPAFGGKGFFGERVHKAVLESSEKFSGCTVHFADLEYDQGPIILQKVIPVHPDDTPDSLAHRVFEQECIAYPEAIRLFAEGRLEVEGDKVTIRNGQL